MVARSKLERVHGHDGIVAVLGMDKAAIERGEPSWVGEDRWREVAMAAVQLLRLSKQPQIRVLVGDYAVLVSGDEDDIVGVVFVKGHPVVKSVVRMLRQLLRHARNASAATPPPPRPPSVAPMPPAQGFTL